MLRNKSSSSNNSAVHTLLRLFFVSLACFYGGGVAAQSQEQQSCADRSDFAAIATIAGTVSEVSLGLRECVYADGTPIHQAFTMTRFVWTVEPTDGNATTISTNAGNLVSAVTTPIIVAEDEDDPLQLSKNGTVLLEFLPGSDLLAAAAPDAKGREVGLVLQIPRDQLVDLESNFRDASVVLQLVDGFTRLRGLAVLASSTQSSAAHVVPGEGPALKGVVNSSQHPLRLSLKGNAMDVQLESATTGFGSVYIESRNSHIHLKGDILENTEGNNRILGGNKDLCEDDNCGRGLKVVIEGSIDGTIEVTNVNGFSSGAPTPVEPLVKVHVNDPTGNFDCDDGTLFVAFAGETDLGPGIQCATTTDTVTAAPPFNCTTDPAASYKNVLTCPANGQGEKPEDETCECTVAVPSPASNNGGGGGNAPPSPSSNAVGDSGVRERIYTDRLLVLVFIGLATLLL